MAWWLLLTLSLLGGVFAALAFIWGHGAWPEETADVWLRDVVVSTVPVAGLLGAAVVVATTFKRQQLELDQDERQTTRDLRERFTTVAGQLGHESSAVRIAGVYAAAALADDWQEQGNRTEMQVCIDLLCAYLRSPRRDPLPGEPAHWTPAQQAETQVRTTVSNVIAEHLKAADDAGELPWAGCTFNLSGAVFDAGHHNFARIHVGAKTVLNLAGAKFRGGDVSFAGAEFRGGAVSFAGAEFRGGDVSFAGAKFRGGAVSFYDAQFRGGAVSFAGAEFSADEVLFDRAEFSGGDVSFAGARFSGGVVVFFDARFSGGEVLFDRAKFSGAVLFDRAKFSGAVSFYNAEFSGGDMSFYDAQFSGGQVRFGVERNNSHGVDFHAVDFHAVDFHAVEFHGTPWGVVGLPAVWPPGDQ